MTHDLALDAETAPFDDSPTERFAVQKCPRCSALTTVPLCLLTSACEACGSSIEVAPWESE